MRKLLTILIFTALALSLGSCRVVDRARSKIKFHGIEDVRMKGLTNLEVKVRVENGTRYKLVLDKADIEVTYDGAVLASAELRDGITVDKRTTESITTSWQLDIGNPLVALVALKRVRGGDTSCVTVNMTAEGRGGPMPVNISRKNIPLSDFLNIFGITMDDINKFL